MHRATCLESSGFLTLNPYVHMQVNTYIVIDLVYFVFIISLRHLHVQCGAVVAQTGVISGGGSDPLFCDAKHYM